MRANVGSRDRVVRIVGGMILMAIGLYWLAWVAIVGAIILLTAVAGWCPIYGLFHLDTTDRDDWSGIRHVPHLKIRSKYVS